eukprot:CAMPEP_0172416224 /NCGR_PEP_ID=MMETSP1064-20121228/2696_1 /TAXON_ID=202472 /ORGANISM="Aulacoseira subarctica , Strain CCAP 1002/5" /LENGTH=264 /DNA_ID=CAMNT_0013153727 /DNA_START=183 /DNA_END=980 /DNA_ORIENTATION=-
MNRHHGVKAFIAPKGTLRYKSAQISASKDKIPKTEDSYAISATEIKNNDSSFPSLGRRSAIDKLAEFSIFVAAAPACAQASTKKCSDIETCREIGDVKLLEKMTEDPITSLPNGVKYKILQPPITYGAESNSVVKDGSVVDLIYSVTGGGRYMYSQGFGYENVSFDGKMQKDLGLDSLRIVVGNHNVPLGVEQALIGMRRGERRRVVVPPNVGFSTSDWKPEPTTRRGKVTLAAYKQLIEGRGSTQPPFPAPTFWDVEVLRIKK